MARNRDEDFTNEPPRRRRDDDDDDRPVRRRRDIDDDDDDDPRPRRRSGNTRISRADLRTVAISQKVVILCILGILATIPLNFVLGQLPPQFALLHSVGLLVLYAAVNITATVFVFMMALKVYSTGTGVLLGILTLIPCIGLIVLLIINAKATAIMKENGVRVGLLGARMSDLP